MTPKNYLDFELRIGVRAGDSYPITVMNSPFGKPSAKLDLSLTDQSFKQHLQTIERIRGAVVNTRRADQSSRSSYHSGASKIELDAIEAIGRRLFDAVIKPIDSCYRLSSHEARRNEKGLRLRLHIDAPELAVLPWEFLFDHERSCHVAIDRQTPLTRYLSLEHRIESLNVSPPLRILGMTVSPHDQLALDVNQEKKLIGFLSGLIESGMIELEWVAGQTVSALDNKLDEKEWHIFHFVGHGHFNEERQEGSILFADSSGNSHSLSHLQIGNILSRCPTLRLVVLNACEGARASEHNLFSSTASILLKRGIPAVISMQYAISDYAAINFAQNFYGALVRKFPIDAAVTEARFWLSMDKNVSTEWGTPVLYMRSPDGNLFAIDDSVKLDLRRPSFTDKNSHPTTETQTIWGRTLSLLFWFSRFTGRFIPYYRGKKAQTTDDTSTIPNDEMLRGLSILRKNVQADWIDGKLKDSHFQRVLADLDLPFVPNAVDTSWSGELDWAGGGSRTLTGNQSITKIFREVANFLLILGDPGVGKTTVLLVLAEELLKETETDPGLPIPVVFDLSSWQETYSTLDNWLVNELAQKYKVPPKFGRIWLQANRILPLLDGLDELGRRKAYSRRRKACVEAINDFSEKSSVGLVVCCRWREYEQLQPLRLRLNAAIRLQPRTDFQVAEHLNLLDPMGKHLAGLKQALRLNSTLRIEARIMVHFDFMIRAYWNRPLETIIANEFKGTEACQDQVIEDYIERIFDDKLPTENSRDFA